VEPIRDEEPTTTFTPFQRAFQQSNFTTRVGKYMIRIAQKKLPVQPAPYPEKALYEWVTPDKSAFCLCGYGTVAESFEWIKDLYEGVMNFRRKVKLEEQT
jgi:hypothetical protein